MTPHRHWLRNYAPKRVAIKLADNNIVYSTGCWLLTEHVTEVIEVSLKYVIEVIEVCH